MTDTTDTFWSVNGTSLQTLAWNITTLGGDAATPPPFRGSDATVPGRKGSLWLPKVEADRVITFSMWAQGSNDDGSAPDDDSARAKYEANWRALRKLLWNPRKQLTLTKRFRPYGSDIVRTVTAKAQYNGTGLAPTMQGNAHSTFTVDLKLNDPYFYSDPVTVPTMTDAAGVKTFTVDGDGRTTRIQVVFTGPLGQNKKLALNTADGDSMWVNYLAGSSSGDKVLLDVDSFTSTTTPNGGTAFNSNGYISHYGDVYWLALDPGSNKATFTSDGASNGTAVLSYQEAWI